MKFKKSDLTLSHEELKNKFEYHNGYMYYKDTFGKLSSIEYSLSDDHEKLIPYISGNSFKGPVLAARVLFNLVHNKDFIRFEYIDKNPMNISIDNIVPCDAHISYHRMRKLCHIIPKATGIKYTFIRTLKSGEVAWYFYKYVFDDHGNFLYDTSQRCVDRDAAIKKSEAQVEYIRKLQRMSN